MNGGGSLTLANTNLGGTIVDTGSLDVEGSIVGPVSTTDGGEIVGTDAAAATVSVDDPSTGALIGQAATNTGEWSYPAGNNVTLTASFGERDR